MDDNNSILGRCINCKNWVKNEFVLQGYPDDYRMCSKADEDYNGGLFDAVCSSEGIGAELITRKDFGCVYFNK